MSDSEAGSDFEPGTDYETVQDADAEENDDVEDALQEHEGVADDSMQDDGEPNDEAAHDALDDNGMDNPDPDAEDHEEVYDAMQDVGHHPEAVDAWDNSMEEEDLQVVSRQANQKGSMQTSGAKVHIMEDMPSSVFPSSRIKRIMNTDPAVKMISADAVACMTRAAELFVGELAHAGYKEAFKEKKKTVMYPHLARAAAAEEALHFLTGILPEERAQRSRARVDLFGRPV
jgi:histone H3/H4